MTALRFALIFALLCFSPVAGATDIFGFDFGKPIDLPECERFPTANPRLKIYNSVQQQTCIEDPVPYGNRVIHFGMASSPKYVKERRATVSMAAGELCAVQYYTWGIRDQDELLEQLRATYGKPSSLIRSTGKNLYGAALPIIHARWTSKTAEISLDGAIGDFETGDVTIMSLIPQCAASKPAKSL
jgi:hypothetical protein